jgi:hypothetical protein
MLLPEYCFFSPDEFLMSLLSVWTFWAVRRKKTDLAKYYAFNFSFDFQYSTNFSFTVPILLCRKSRGGFNFSLIVPSISPFSFQYQSNISSLS